MVKNEKPFDILLTLAVILGLWFTRLYVPPYLFVLCGKIVLKSCLLSLVKITLVSLVLSL